MDAFSALGGVFQGLSNFRSSGTSKLDKQKPNVGAMPASKPPILSAMPASKPPGMGPMPASKPFSMGNIFSRKPPGMGGMGGMGGMPPIKQGGLGGSKISASQILSGGMPCKFELTMEFFCSFFFTFIIYFLVFAFVPYDGLITKILEFIRDITKKFMDFLYKLVPNPVKKAASRLFPKFVVKFFKETLPKLLSKKSEELTTPLKKKLKEIKDDIDKKINGEKKKLGKNKDFISEMTLYYNEQYLIIKGKLTALWEKFKDKIVPALIMSFIYYVIWFTFFKLIPTILKYLMNVAQQFKQP